MSDDAGNKTMIVDPQTRNQFQYGTFQGVANYYPPASHPQPTSHPVVGFPQPVSPTVISSQPCYQSHLGYHAVPVHGYAILEGRPLLEARLPCCGLGMGWLLFIVGFFLGGIPWYLGTFILLFVRVDYREKPGYVACVIASVLAIIAITLGITKGTDS